MRQRQHNFAMEKVRKIVTARQLLLSPELTLKGDCGKRESLEEDFEFQRGM